MHLKFCRAYTVWKTGAAGIPPFLQRREVTGGAPGSHRLVPALYSRVDRSTHLVGTHVQG